MLKYIIALIFSYNIAIAGLVNSIYALVNNEPITLYDIDKKAQKLHISNQQALDILIDEILYEQELKHNNITVDLFDIDKYIKQLAMMNGLSAFEFKNAIRQQQDYDKFEEDIKKKLLHQKLIQKIAQGKIQKATDEDLKIYYDNHKNMFYKPTIIEVTKYSSKNRSSLQQIRINPMANIKDVYIENLNIDISTISNEQKYILLNTKEGAFSPIFIDNRLYNLYYIIKKKDIQIEPFHKVKNKIFQIVMKQREDEFLKEYFTKLKLKANIKIIKE
jgi:hypothetical protein